MSRFVNFVIGFLSFVSVLILLEPLSRWRQDQGAHLDALNACVHILLILGAIKFLQFALDRYLFPPDFFTKERRKAVMESAEAGYRKTFFRGTLGVGYLCFFFYALDLFDTTPGIVRETNWMASSLFFLLLGMVGRTRGVILYLLTEQRTDAAAA